MVSSQTIHLAVQLSPAMTYTRPRSQLAKAHMRNFASETVDVYPWPRPK